MTLCRPDTLSPALNQIMAFSGTKEIWWVNERETGQETSKYIYPNALSHFIGKITKRTLDLQRIAPVGRNVYNETLFTDPSIIQFKANEEMEGNKALFFFFRKQVASNKVR